MKTCTTSLLCTFFIFCFPILGKSQANVGDSLALVALYNSTDGANWTNTWDLNSPVSGWSGVVLDGDGRVTYLSLAYNQLSGSIPTEIGNLTNLTNMYMRNNQLTGNIPSEFGSLVNLTSLNLVFNQLTDSIPVELGNLTNLTYLNLYLNQLTGSIPEELGNLTNLTYLNLGANQFTSSIPMELGNLTNLTSLNLPHNQFTGNTPPELGNLTNLTSLYLNGNQFTGNIPPELGNLTSLTHLGLYDNQLTGNIPLELENLTNLTSLGLYDNQLTGNIPPELGNLTNLTSLQLHDNQLSSNIPAELGNLTNLTYLNLEANQLSGSIPPELDNLINLTNLRLSSNQLSGSIPPELGNLINLTNLRLSSNQLSGCYDINLMNLCQLPNAYIDSGNNFNATWDDFCNNGAGTCPPCSQSDSLNLVALYDATNGLNWTNIWNLNQPMDTWYGVTLDVNGCVTCLDLNGGLCLPGDGVNDGNNLAGTIPSEIGNLTNLINLDLGGNQLNGSIPPELGNLTNLEYLNLHLNQLSGSIPTELENLTNLTQLYINSNQLSGSIPTEFGNLVNLTDLRMSGNQLSGSIPTELENLTNLTQLYINSNQLSGSIPTEFGNLINLTDLRMSGNQLSGSIPVELGNLTNLIQLFLGNNQLSGCYDVNLSNLCSQLISSSISSGNNFDITWDDFCNTGVGTCPYCNGNDSLSLVAFYNATDGPNWINAWDLSQPVETWYGVTLNGDGCVVELDLNSNQLNGTIPTEFGDLTNLTQLYLNDNQLSGCYNSYLANFCSQLTGFSISDGNNFDTTWDDFCNTGGGTCLFDSKSDSLALVALYNATNGPNWSNVWDLNQPVSTWLGVGVNEDGRVTHLQLENRQLNGNIPPEIGNLTSLTFLNFDINQLTGNIPVALGNLTNLITLGLRINQFSGSIPAELGNLSNLVNLRLSNNQLSGGIPAELGNLTNLATLFLGNNELRGSIPTELGNLTNLTNLYLKGTMLTGSIPSELGNLSNLVYLYLEENYLNGSIPPELANLSNLVYLYLDNNQLTGSIPPELGNLSNLIHLYLSNNQLSDNIPPELGNLNNLAYLYLNSNQLSGNIPAELGNLSNLEILHLSSNQLSGNIPAELGNLSNLTFLSLTNNELSGNIPVEIGNLSNLESLYLEENQLTGNIPPELGNLSNLIYLTLDNNQLTGSIPNEMLNLNSLGSLYLGENQLSGHVQDFSVLPNMTYFSITENRFSFDDIEATYTANNTLQFFKYSVQYHGEPQEYIQEVGNTLTIGFSAPLPGNNNQNVSYRYFKNSNILTGITDSTYTINDLQLSNVGEYTIQITDPLRVPNLAVYSEPIYVIVPGYDLYGQPVVYNQIMVEFDNEFDRQSYEDEHLYPNAGFVQDSCDCNRGLYLWQFPTDTVALQVLLDINTRVEAQDDKTDVDGGPNNIFNLGVSNNSGTAWSWTGDYTGITYQDSVSVFMLDSGLDEGNWDASPYLLPNVPTDSCYNIAAPGYDYTDSLVTFTTNYVDSLGHGTFGFRSVVEGLNDYMDIKSVPLKVFDQNGEGTLFKFVCALYHAIDHGADVVNISAGYRGQPSGILEEAVQLAQQKGIFIVTAAGNDGENIDSIPQFPAYFSGTTYEYEIAADNTVDIPYDNVISVASINAQDSLSVFSNYGTNNATLAAYGENMSGYGVGGVNVISSGTSISTFYVTRELAAEIAKNKNRSLQDIWSDFETNRLVSNPPTQGLIKTGKRLDIQIVNTCLPTLVPGGDIADGIYQAGQVINSDGTIPTGSNVQFKAGGMIILESGFQVQPQSEFTGEIEDCDGN